MIDPKSISAIVLNFRTADKTLKCLKSLQDEGVNYIVLVDNSEDGGCSLAEMKEALSLFQEQGLNVYVLTDSSNQGFARGVNTGFRKAKKLGLEFILLLNSDAYFEKGGIEQMLKMSQTYDCVQPMVRNGTNVNSLFGYYNRALALNFSKPTIGCLRYSSGCCLMIKTKSFGNSILDEDFFFYGEDIELAFRAKKSGLKFVECDEAFIHHEGSGSAKRGSLFYEYHINKGHFLTAKKLSNNFFEMIMFYFFRAFTLSARAISRSIRYASLIPMRGFLMAGFDFIRGRSQSLTPPPQTRCKEKNKHDSLTAN